MEESKEKGRSDEKSKKKYRTRSRNKMSKRGGNEGFRWTGRRRNKRK